MAVTIRYKPKAIHFRFYNGDALEILTTLSDNSIECCVTDPPYGLSKEPDIVEVMTHWLKDTTYNHTSNGFMGKSWDSFVPSPVYWRELFRVLKPGAYALVFAGSRTQDLMSIALRFAGFEIRDTLMWVYGSGFPKSLNISKQMLKQGDIPLAEWEGWGTALKPAYEPIIMVRKPLEGTVAETILKWGVGGLNIDASRIGTTKNVPASVSRAEEGNALEGSKDGSLRKETGLEDGHNPNIGRFPSNFIHDGSEEVTELFPDVGSGNNKTPYSYAGKEYDNKDTSMFNGDKPQAPSNYNDKGSAARFFYCAKTSKKERGEGNSHPTVKPIALMKYLCKLVCPPKGTVLDPFMGSGSTGLAAVTEGFYFIGIEKDNGYVEIAKGRMATIGKL